MNVSLDDLVPSIRNIINDDLMTDGIHIDEYETSAIFTLPEPQAQSVLSVTVNGSASGVVYTFNSSRLQVTISSSLTYGDTIAIYYSYYNKYSNAEIKNKIKSALIQLSVRGIFDYSVIGNFVRPEPSYKERNLICWVTGILIEPNNVSYRLPDISVIAPGKSLTTNDLIGQILCLYKKDSTGIFSLIGGFDEGYKSNKIGGLS